MQRIIDRKLYDTEVAEQIGKHGCILDKGDVKALEETLYRDLTGEYFLHCQGGAATQYAEQTSDGSTYGETLELLTEEEALDWCEKRSVSSETAIEEFADHPEDVITSQNTVYNRDYRSIMHYNNPNSDEDDETAQRQVVSEPIEEIIDEIQPSQDDIAAITVKHPLPREEMGPMHIVIHTDVVVGPMVDPMRHVTATEAVIDVKNGDQVGILYDIHTISDNPSTIETVNMTTVYRSDDVEDADPITVDDGLDRLRWKLGKTSEEIQSALREER